ncbi:hypothetical protein K501DRAFT_261448, partial [Backusella circina FSU 941]
MDGSISSREQQPSDPFDPLYQNIIPEINQVPLIFVPEDPSAIYNSLIVSPEAMEHDNGNSLYPIVPAHEDINIPLREEEVISPIYPNISSFDPALWNNGNHRRGDSLPTLTNHYPLSSMVNGIKPRLKKSLTTNSSDQKYSVTFEERRHLVHLANVFQAPGTA